MWRRASLLAGVLALVATGCGSDDESTKPTSTPTTSANTEPALEKLGTFEEPIYIAQPRGDDSLYVVERAGRLRAVESDGATSARPLLDISKSVSTDGEGGMFSVAFPPDFDRSRLLYVAYAGRDHRLHLDEYRLDESAERIDPGTRRAVLAIEHPNDIHWGGLALFGPDGHLYLGTGDGGPVSPIPSTAQSVVSPLGKMLRIDPAPSGGRAYSVPKDNPYVGRPGDDKIYELGLRNPWRYSFDRITDDLWIGDVGDYTQEEIDHLTRAQASGANLGWPDLEGTAEANSDVSAPGSIPPVFTYARTGKEDDPFCAVTGGYVDRDPELPSLRGRYLYADFCHGHIRSFRLAGGQARDDRDSGLVVPRLASFGEDADGHLYAVSLEGSVYRLVER